MVAKKIRYNGELSFSTVATFMGVVQARSPSHRPVHFFGHPTPPHSLVGEHAPPDPQRYNRNPFMRTKAVGAFVEHCIKKDAPDAYEVFRLVLPQSDRRGFTGMTQHRLIYLITVVVKLVVEQHPRLAERVSHNGEGDFYSTLFRWQDKDDLALALGEPTDLSELLKEKVFDVFCGDMSMSDAEKDLAVRMNDDRIRSLTVAEVNLKLDELSDACVRQCVEHQVDIFAWFMQRLTSEQMMWLVQIVLKKTRIWIKERDVLEQAPWGEEALTKFFQYGAAFESLLRGSTIPTAISPCGNTGPRDQADVQAYPVGPLQQAVQGTVSRSRQSQVVMSSIDDAFRYMERRFKPGNYQPMQVIAEASFDGIKVRIRRVNGEVQVQYSDDEKRRGSPACEGTVLLDAVHGMVPGADFEIEADVCAWNTFKECAEPRFILDALMDADLGVNDGARISCGLQPSHMALLEHLELLVLITDIISYKDDSMLDQWLQTRLENLGYFEAKRWGPEIGFPVPVHVVPLVPGTMIAGVPISVVSDNPASLKELRDSMEFLGAKALSLRAPEVEWNTVEKMARVQVLNTSTLSILNCAVMGYWREQREVPMQATSLRDESECTEHTEHAGTVETAERRVSHWLLGVVNDTGEAELGSQGEDSAFKRILKVRNLLHATDERATLASLEAGSVIPPYRDPSTGMYVCHFSSTKQTILSVAGRLLAPGKWSSSPLVLTPTLVGLSPPGSTVDSISGICKILEAKRGQASRDKIPSVRFRDKKVAERFRPCGTRASVETPGILKDTTVYFVNHTADPAVALARHEAKRRYEDLVAALGGTVVQNYYEGVDMVVAGQPTVVTDAFRNKNIGIVSLAFLDKLASLHPVPAELPRILSDDYLPEWYALAIG